MLGLRCCVRAFSSCSERGYSSLWCAGFSLRWLLLLQSMGSERKLWCTGLVALRHVGSSQTRARTHVPCIGRQILNHCATREAPFAFLGPWILCSCSLSFFYCVLWLFLTHLWRASHLCLPSPHSLSSFPVLFFSMTAIQHIICLFLRCLSLPALLECQNQEGRGFIVCSC